MTSKYTPPETPPEAFNNPYYPLSGPPTTDKEREILTNHIHSERDAMKEYTSIMKSLDTQLDLATQQNCADIRWQHYNCVAYGSFKEKAFVCNKWMELMDNCMKKQKEFLIQLGYKDLIMKKASEQEKLGVMDKADALWCRYRKENDIQDPKA